MSLLGSPGPPPPSPPPPRWLPTHVQVTVLRARGLRGKGTGGSSTSDAYAVIQLGPDRYRTSVVEKTAGCPEWREECTFQLPPAALPRPDPDPGGPPPPDGSPPDPHLLLTAMHRSLIGLDKFLGRAVVPLDPLLRAGRDPHTQWYKLHSKVGKREKERGEIQVTIQLTRTSLSASMFDLSAPDKPRSPFGKLKDKVKGHRKFELESASAIIPGSVGRLEDAEGLELDGKKGKAKGFFFRNKLRKSSLTRSSTSLGSDSTISSASGSLAPGFGTLELEGAGSPGRNNSLSGREAVSLPKTLTHKRAFSDEASQVTVALPRAVHDLKAKNDPVSRSSLCVNGSHVYNEEPRPAAHRPFPLSGSLQNLAPRGAQDGPGPRPASAKAEGPPWGGAGGFGAGPADAAASPRPAGPGGRAREEEGGGGEGERRAEGKPVQIATPLVFGEREDARREEKKTRPGLFLHHHHGGVRSEPGPRGPGDKPSPQNPAGADDRGKGGWFGSRDAKEPGQKPSPHPVKPISATPSDGGGEKKQHRSSLTTALSSGLERLKTVTSGGVQPVAPAPQQDKESKKLKDPSPSLDGSARYYHLTHDELIKLLLQRERELSQRDEHVRELESYIDRLLVRIMEQSPSLLQITLDQPGAFP
ncbi:rab11 family-interacting protein 5 [Ornithorhynchus anatinus]|uniref:RAB11 family interacting protein 5 n=1 Tax=Ornithorhynchus anatinus TaxID=9258 RepID=A0A6I8P0W2_ORNAN|nr:rab11 family-interacting protein 5 [Ornithorhynchus anatinus]